MSEALVFRPVAAEEFEDFAAQDRERYARDMVENGGMSLAEAAAKAERDQAAVLTAGVATPGQALYFVTDVEDGARIGRVWLGDRRPVLFVYAIWLDEAVRGRGLGRQIMRWIEQEAARRECDRIELNVFAGNSVARRLYQSLGYDEVAVYMRKDVSRAGSSGPPTTSQ
jgi:GNAT superfamily N-acetyltransferase